MLKNSLLLIIITYFALMSCGKGSAPAKSGSESKGGVKSPKEVQQAIDAGLEIFKKTCMGGGCHENINDNRLKKANTAAGITNAINSVPSMSGISLSDTDKNNIAEYIKAAKKL